MPDAEKAPDKAAETAEESYPVYSRDKLLAYMNAPECKADSGVVLPASRKIEPKVGPPPGLDDKKERPKKKKEDARKDKDKEEDHKQRAESWEEARKDAKGKGKDRDKK